MYYTELLTMNNIKYDILYNCFIIIYKIDNNLLLFINDYKINLFNALNKVNKKDASFILNADNKDLKTYCNKIIIYFLDKS